MPVTKDEDIDLGPISVTPAPKPRPPRGTTGVGPISVAPTPTGPENIADAVMTVADRTRDIFRESVRQTAVQYAPDTTFWTAGVKNDPVTTAATSEALEFFATVYGGENLASFFVSELLEDDLTRERTFAALSALRGRPELIGGAQAQRFAWAGGAETGTSSSQEVMERYLANPASLEAMSYGEKGQVAGIADELLAALQDVPDAGLTTDQLRRAVAIGATGDVTLALSEGDIESLRLIAQFKGFGAGGSTIETPFLESVGIEQIRQLADGVIVLDLDDAQASPDRAFAVKTWLEQNYPDMEIQYGRQGIAGSLLDKFGIAVDYVSAPVGGALQQLAEFSDQVGTTPEQRAGMLARADELEQSIQNGDIPQDQVAATLRGIVRLRDHGTAEVGWEAFKDQVSQNTRPRQIGFGFAESFTRASDLMPGDPGYAMAYAASGLIANIVADPLNWLIPGIGALKAWRHIPKIPAGMLGSADEIAAGLRLGDPAMSVGASLAAAERIASEAASTGYYIQQVGRGWIKNGLYRRLAKTPEELAVIRPHMQAASRLWRLKQRLGDNAFSAAMGRFFALDPKTTGGTSDMARYLSQATSEEDMSMALVRAQTGVHYTPTNLDALNARKNSATLRLNLDETPGIKSVPRMNVAEKADLVGERAFLTDTIEGRDWVRPMRQVFTSRQLRRLERLSGEPLGVHGRVLAAGIESVEKFPANIIRTFGVRQYRDPENVRSAQEIMSEWGHLHNPTGAGTVLTFPHNSRYAASLRRVGGEVMEDAVEESFGAISDIAKFMGLRNKRINELLAPWTRGELTSASRSFHWWKDTWTSIVDESPKLTAVGKADLRTMWHSMVSDRSPGWITDTSQGGRLPVREPTLYREVVDEATGDITPSGVPAFEADQFQSWRLPTLADLRQNMTTTQRMMSDWRKTGGRSRRAISGAHLGLSQTATSINSVWRTTTLGFRLFGALPARIGMEQMLRIAAYDYASAVWHPVEWFASTRVGTGVLKGSDVALFTDSPVHALGTIINNLDTNPNFYLARAGRETVTLADEAKFPGVYYRSYSERLGRMFASPSVHYWHMPYLGDADRTLDAMRAGDHADDGAEWLAHYAEVGMDPSVAVQRTQTEITQMIGTGEGAEVVRTALRRGAVTVDGQTYRVGTSDFAELLKGMASRGEWRPGNTYLARSAGDYLPADRITALGQFRDNLFRTFYSAPDLATARSPLYRQMAAREFRNLIRRGYTPENALRNARAYAARGTADMMFTIGAKTSGEYFLRNLNPFFPAYRELATTWLKRLPLRVGEGHWALGGAAIVRRADVWLDFFKNIGVVRTDEQGKLYVPIPGLDKLVSMWTGANVPFSVKAPLDTFAGVLPVPIGLFEKDEQGNPLPWHERMRGIFPTLGGPSTVALGVINDLFGGKLDIVEDYATLYGTDASLGPTAVDRAFEAFGITMPWMTNTTADYHEAVRTWAVIDGMRIAMSQRAIPTPDEFDANADGDLTPEEQNAYDAAKLEYAEYLALRGERYAEKTYLIRAIAGMTLPFSIQIEDESKQQMSALWALINSLPAESGLTSPLIDSVLSEYPNLGPYMTGKTQDTRTVEDPGETLDEFMQAVKDEEIQIRTAQDWTVFALGMNSYSIYQSRLDGIYEEAGGSAAEWLVNFDAKDAIDRERQAWNDFLDLSTVRDNFLPGQTQSFMDMFETYQQYKQLRDGDSPRLSIQQEQLLEFDRTMKEYAKYFSPNPESSDDYFKLKDEAFAALGDAGQSDLARGVSWWFETVADPYYTTLDKLYNEVSRTEPADRAPIYQKIRDLTNEYNQDYTHPGFGNFPTPEEYSFLKKTNSDQRMQVAEWANLPATFLTEFQREQVGYTIPEGKQDAANRLASLITRGDFKLKQAVEKNDLSYASTAVQDVRAGLQQFYGQRAQEWGIGNYWRELNAPQYVRIGNALNLSQRTATWTEAVDLAAKMQRLTEAEGYVPGGGSEIDEAFQQRFLATARTWIRNDSEFRSILDELAVALGDDSPLPPEQLLLTLFFDKYYAA